MIGGFCFSSFTKKKIFQKWFISYSIEILIDNIAKKIFEFG